MTGFSSRILVFEECLFESNDTDQSICCWQCVCSCSSSQCVRLSTRRRNMFYTDAAAFATSYAKTKKKRRNSCNTFFLSFYIALYVPLLLLYRQRSSRRSLAALSFDVVVQLCLRHRVVASLLYNTYYIHILLRTRSYGLKHNTTLDIEMHGVSIVLLLHNTRL